MIESKSLPFDVRVALGVDHLNRVDPGWFHHVDLAILDIGHGKFCILAQLTRKKWESCIPQYRIWGPEQQLSHGFYIDISSMPKVLAEYRHAQLTAAWKRAIVALRAGTYVGAVEIAA